ncbi:hypothetical protein U1Q18_025440, partial [Sarracenia purpurea var. burkii]
HFSFASLVTDSTKVGSSEVVGVGGGTAASPPPSLRRPCFLQEIRYGFLRCVMCTSVALSLTGGGRRYRRWRTGVASSSSLPQRSLPLSDFATSDYP